MKRNSFKALTMAILSSGLVNTYLGFFSFFFSTLLNSNKAAAAAYCYFLVILRGDLEELDFLLTGSGVLTTGMMMKELYLKGSSDIPI